MLALRFIRENIDQVRRAVANRQDTAPPDEILELDSERRQKLLELAEQENIVLMCKERSDLRCHHRYIVETLANKGIKTIPLI